MRVLFVNAAESRGGAARAAGRIARAVRSAGAEVELLAGEPSGKLGLPVRRATPGFGDFAGKLVERAPLLAWPKRAELIRRLTFSPAARTRDVVAQVNRAGADLVHLHWVNYGLLSPEGIAAIRAPVVWTLHDMWPLTGGCHYARGCEGYRAACGRCPALGGEAEADLSRALLARKQAAWRGRGLHLVAPSRWMAERVRDSALFAGRPVRVIANPVDVAVFSPGDQAAARARLGLPQDTPLLLFGGQRAVENPAKGYAALEAALGRLPRPPLLVVFGSGEDARRRIAPGLPVRLLGPLSREADLVDAYRAADLLAAPSLDDNLPGTVIEALACGTPVVGFASGGLPDMVRPRFNGFLAPAGDVDGLARALSEALAAVRASDGLARAARRSALEQFSPTTAARAYLEVYRTALAPARAAAG